MIFYGAATEVWLRRKMREVQKSAGYGRTKPNQAMAICLVAPKTPEKEQFNTHEATLVAKHPEIPAELALQGFNGVRAYSSDPDRSRALLEEALMFEPRSDGWESRGERRGSLYAYDEPPAERGLQGAGSVHHVAWASTPEELMDWREKAVTGGAQPTPEIDRFYFRSIYFREPSGVLFEIATLGPGFTVDEPVEHLGEKLSLPPAYEHLREEVEPKRRPVVNPRVKAQG